jgi:hypothetical protein
MRTQAAQTRSDLRTLEMGVIVLVARTNKLQDLQPLVPSLRKVLERLQPGELIRVTS